MTEHADVSAAIRARRYLELAGDARRHAAATKGEMRESYIVIAEQWERLAAHWAREIETTGAS
jgi:hypothetical protein